MYDIISSHWHALLFEELNISSIYHAHIIIPIQFEHTRPGPSPFRSQALGAKLRLAGPKWFDQLGQGHCGQRGVGRWWVSPLGKMHPFLTSICFKWMVQPLTSLKLWLEKGENFGGWNALMIQLTPRRCWVLWPTHRADHVLRWKGGRR